MATKKKRSQQNGSPQGCVGGLCDWQATAQGGKSKQANGIILSCEESPVSGCTQAKLLDAGESDFHGRALIEATRKINRILAGVPKDSHGRMLSFCQTKMGTLLAWVEHGGEASRRRVTARDDDATVAKALKLKVACFRKPQIKTRSQKSPSPLS